MREAPAPLPGRPRARSRCPRGAERGRRGQDRDRSRLRSPAGRWRPPGRSSGQRRGRGRPPACQAAPIPLLPPGCGGSRCCNLLFLSFPPHLGLSSAAPTSSRAVLAVAEPCPGCAARGRHRAPRSCCGGGGRSAAGPGEGRAGAAAGLPARTPPRLLKSLPLKCGRVFQLKKRSNFFSFQKKLMRLKKKKKKKEGGKKKKERETGFVSLGNRSSDCLCLKKGERKAAGGGGGRGPASAALFREVGRGGERGCQCGCERGRAGAAAAPAQPLPLPGARPAPRGREGGAAVPGSARRSADSGDGTPAEGPRRRDDGGDGSAPRLLHALSAGGGSRQPPRAARRPPGCSGAAAAGGGRRPGSRPPAARRLRGAAAVKALLLLLLRGARAARERAGRRDSRRRRARPSAGAARPSLPCWARTKPTERDEGGIPSGSWMHTATGDLSSELLLLLSFRNRL
ncbi:cyclin-dependent kinase 4 inhibitor C isoform X1 [Taeniopygia guttata]|uniref:cyclin-dependent kinase 4 inhibitor C isoform X1 n=1 Tax=Taeniopygia guttata TaxID=59729 RepID=UPI003BB90783